MRKVLPILALIIAGIFAPDARAQNIELQCPAGMNPIMPSGVVIEGSTGKQRQWLCADSNGNVNIQGVSNSTGTVIQNGLLAEYRILPSETAGSLIDYSSNQNN